MKIIYFICIAGCLINFLVSCANKKPSIGQFFAIGNFNKRLESIKTYIMAIEYEINQGTLEQEESFRNVSKEIQNLNNDVRGFLDIDTYEKLHENNKNALKKMLKDLLKAKQEAQSLKSIAEARAQARTKELEEYVAQTLAREIPIKPSAELLRSAVLKSWEKSKSSTLKLLAKQVLSR